MSEPRPRGRLFRKYVLVLLLLVGGVLLVSSAVDLYFSYQETKAALVRIGHEQAVAAAGRIEQFVRDIEQQVRWTTQTAFDDPVAAQEQREIDYLRLLRNVPAIAEISHLDASGKERLRVSRMGLDAIGSEEDHSRAPKFLEARAGTPYFSAVYFRNESEPYMTLAVRGGEHGVDVTVAEVNLKAIWDVVSRIRTGEAGYAYVVDSLGRLVAHPDISLVLQKRDVAALPQVLSARGPQSATGDEGVGMVAQGLHGGQVLAAYAPVAPLGWVVFVEQPIGEAFAPLRAFLARSIILFGLGLGLSVLASVLLARRMVAPIRVLQDGAVRIGAGDLSHRIQIRTGDELEALGEEFNRTAARLEESYASLEQKVEMRTRELADANAGLSEALEQQTVTGEILRVISTSPTDLQPVLDAVVRSAARFCGAYDAAIFHLDGGGLRLTAHHGPIPSPVLIPVVPGTVVGRSVREGRAVHVVDLQVEREQFPEGSAFAREFGHRTVLSVPLLREGTVIGAINLRRTEEDPFTDKQIALLQIFADQAVIAIENVRLFQELQARTRELGRSVEELKALGEVGRAVSSTLDLETVLNTIVTRAVQLSSTQGGALYEFDETTQEFSRIRGAHGLDDDLAAVLRATPLRLGEGAAGKAVARQAPVQVADVLVEGTYDVARVRAIFERRGYRSVLAVPLLFERQIVGVLVVWGREPGSFAQEIVDLLQTLATQSVLAIQNARLFHEIADKSQQLEAASRHKSEFLANMSHELRTPLNAIIGFSEVLAERMFGEVNAKQAEYLQDILGSGRHLLSLINDILDLSKVEAGRLELELERFHLPTALDNALTLVRERAARHGITLTQTVDEQVGDIVADERKVKQILLNLLSNAVKFTPEGGRVGLTATAPDGVVTIAVSDTGVGIAPEDQAAIFEEFRQVGHDDARKQEGTGLGLTLAKKFVELHGGRLWVQSQVGRGSTFTFTLPVRTDRPSSSE